jgi:hypothetical protein
LLDRLTAQGHGASTARKVSGGLLLSGVPVDLIDDFLRDFENDRESVLTDTRPIRQYIADRRDDELAEWDVLVSARNSAPRSEQIDVSGWCLAPITRSIGAEAFERGVLAVSGKRARVASRGMEKAGVDVERAAEAEARYRSDQKVSAEDDINYPDRIYREARTRPLFILFNIAIKPDGLSEEQQTRLPSEPVVGWGISFPKSARGDQTVEYILNTTKLRELFGEDDSDEGQFSEDE